jgi:hypothetical protein
MEINIASLFVIVGMAIWIAIQNYRIKQQNQTIKNGNDYYKKLHNENVRVVNDNSILNREFERAKKTIVHQENVIKYFCRLVDEVPEIEKAYNDLIGGNEKL